MLWPFRSGLVAVYSAYRSFHDSESPAFSKSQLLRVSRAILGDTTDARGLSTFPIGTCRSTFLGCRLGNIRTTTHFQGLTTRSKTSKYHGGSRSLPSTVPRGERTSLHSWLPQRSILRTLRTRCLLLSALPTRRTRVLGRFRAKQEHRVLVQSAGACVSGLLAAELRGAEGKA